MRRIRKLSYALHEKVQTRITHKNIIATALVVFYATPTYFNLNLIIIKEIRMDFCLVVIDYYQRACKFEFVRS